MSMRQEMSVVRGTIAAVVPTERPEVPQGETTTGINLFPAVAPTEEPNATDSATAVVMPVRVLSNCLVPCQIRAILSNAAVLTTNGGNCQLA